ncbi:hypothetical protein MJO28_002033 [Puccinia striiformis f. sp. tritici]|uniref:Uncharacterized protein n=3 Tax=Puccinia striiformis TaxID=27350 RepID=A0A2S4URL7_9BASI|nr:hypothetical protein MJO28_002033 [Puccinia striiformis f. sp. tritici]POV99938.1 hypothetical protein PSHT_13318 [Puccinia striiformis]POW04861.1 hypothetical protein PSTT_10109 [Puccinia striiformis]
MDIQSVRTSEVSCGFFNLMNNKGIVGVRVTIRRSDASQGKGSNIEEVLTFVNAHLAANNSGIPDRNRDYQSIVKPLLFETINGERIIF